MRTRIAAAVLASFVSLVLITPAEAQPTAFTYQGQLKSGAQPAAGPHDFRFRLYNAASGGFQFGPTVCADNVTVTNGQFTATIDFGQQFAIPAARFLEIEVRSDTGLGCATATGFIPLGPRQPLTAAPLASHAKSAFSLAAADGSPADAVLVDNDGDVGIGTTAPAVPLHIARDLDPVLVIQDTGPASTQSGYVGFWNAAASETGWFGFGTPGSPHFSVVNARTGGDILLLPASGRNVGIGTGLPAMPLHVRHEEPVLILQDSGSNSTQSGYLGFWNSTNTETAWAGFGTPGSPDFTIFNGRISGNIVLTPGAGGVVRVPVLEITGADLAEKFPASEKLEPGMVAAIDPANPGKLCLARGRYNPAVAGIVSGANDLAAGAVLGNLPGHADAPAIALSGRVYVWCDASSGPIAPGDLLTTSAVPGHAMKATDRALSHGAVIGKAMQPLESGRGLVLVLVNLQ